MQIYKYTCLTLTLFVNYLNYWKIYFKEMSLDELLP